MYLEPTEEEKRAIAALQRIAKKWPKSLWLFSASGSLCVMRTLQGGEHATERHGEIDPDYHLATIDIPNDGGDW
jgi:hypothetical protein